MGTGLGLAGLLVLGACGSGGAADAGESTAPSATSSVAVASPASEPVAAGPAVGEVVDFADLARRAGVAAKAKKTVRTTGSAADGTMTGEVDYAAPAMRFTMEAASGRTEAILLDGVIYLRMAALSGLTGGKEWVKIDPSGNSPVSQAVGPLLAQLFTMLKDPMNGVGLLEGVKATVIAADATGTTYESTLTAQQAQQMSEKLLAGSPLGAGVVPEGVHQSSTMKHTMAPDGLPMKAVVVSEGGEESIFEYHDWGQPVSITAPPADQVGTI